MKEKVMNGLEKFSKAMLSPLSYISAAGLILVLGALLTSTSLSAMIPVLQWTPIKLLGQLIYNCIMVIINNLSLMFCVGIAAALAKKNKQQAAIIGLMSYFMYLTAGNVTLTQLGMLAEADPMVGLYGTGQSTVFGIQTVDMGVFGGILLGLLLPAAGGEGGQHSQGQQRGQKFLLHVCELLSPNSLFVFDGMVLFLRQRGPACPSAADRRQLPEKSGRI